MKLTCTQENLNKALIAIGKIVNRNATLPILNNFLLQTDKGRVKLSSTNLEMGINCWIGGKISEEGKITVPTRLFSNFVANLPNQNIKINQVGDNLKLSCDNYKTEIKGISADDFPLIPEIEGSLEMEVKSLPFKEALIQVLPSVSISESRPEITGVLIDFSRLEKGELVLAATDSYRLAEKIVKLDGKNKENGGFPGEKKSLIVPRNTAQELSRILDSGENGELKIVLSESQILFDCGNVNLISRLVEGQYPDYQQIIPAKFKNEVIIDSEEFQKAIKVSSLFADLRTNSVFLKTDSGAKTLEIKAEAGEVGKNVSKIPAQIKGEEMEIVFNHHYLVDGLNSIKAKEVVIKTNDSASPAVMSAADDKNKDFLYLIMPVRG